jgi:ABC-type Fe3+ transport system substrate-binding protein
MNQLRHLAMRTERAEKLAAFHIEAVGLPKAREGSPPARVHERRSYYLISSYLELAIPAKKISVFSAEQVARLASSKRGLALFRQIAACAVLLLSLMVRASPAAMAAEKPGWQSEWERTLAGAKKEGAVYLWGDAEITHSDIIVAFTKEFSFIRPITVTGKSGDLTVRLLSERRAGKYLADVYSGTMSGAAFYEFYRSGVFNPIKPTFILPEVTSESGWLGGKHYYVTAENYMILYEGNVAGTSIYYNTQLVKPDDFSSYWDLLAPKWKGKIGMFERAGSSFPSLTPVYYNPHLGPDFIKRLVGEMNVTVSRDRRQATDWLGTGRFALCIGCGDVERASRDGMPVGELERTHLKEAGNNITLNGNSALGLVSKATHPHAAAVFINWFLSRRGQMVWQEVMNTKVGEPSNSMRTDISKDKVLPAARRDDGEKYQVTGFLDPAPPTKLIEELLGRRVAK